MAAVAFGFVLFALVVTVGGGLLLYVLVRSEHAGRTVTDRETAEQIARRDGNADGNDDDDGQNTVRGNHWS